MLITRQLGGNSMAKAGQKKRVYLFDLSAEETTNKSKRIAFTDRIPSLAPCSDSVKAEDMKNARNALVTVVDGLWRNPRLAVPCATWLAGRLEAEVRPRGEGFFSTAPGALKLVDGEFFATFAVAHSKLSLRCRKRHG